MSLNRVVCGFDFSDSNLGEIKMNQQLINLKNFIEKMDDEREEWQDDREAVHLYSALQTVMVAAYYYQADSLDCYLASWRPNVNTPMIDTVFMAIGDAERAE